MALEWGEESAGWMWRPEMRCLAMRGVVLGEGGGGNFGGLGGSVEREELWFN